MTSPCWLVFLLSFALATAQVNVSTVAGSLTSGLEYPFVIFVIQLKLFDIIESSTAMTPILPLIDLLLEGNQVFLFASPSI